MKSNLPNTKEKRALQIILAAVLVLSLFACSAGPKQVTSVTIAGASKGGVWNPLAAEMARMLPLYIPGVEFTSRETLGSLENLRLLTNGDVQVIFAHDYHIARINQGLLSGVSADARPVRILFALYDQPLQIVVRRDAGIHGLADLKGKRVSTGIPGGCAEEMAGFVFKSMGLDIDRDIQRQTLDVIPSAAALQEKQIDAFFWTGAVPTSTITKLFSASAADIDLLAIDEASAAKIMQDNPGVYHLSTVPAGAYPGLETSVSTLGITAVIAAMDSLPAPLVKQLLTVTFDHHDELAGAWTAAGSLTPSASVGLLSDEALEYLHPEAAVYFLRNTRDR